MKLLVYFICFLIVTCLVEARRQRFVKSRRRVRPRGNRHHIFKNGNPSKIQNKSQTTKVTADGNGHKTVKNFNDDPNEFYDYQNYDPNPIKYPSSDPNPYPQNPYQQPGFHPPNPASPLVYPPK